MMVHPSIVAQFMDRDVRCCLPHVWSFAAKQGAPRPRFIFGMEGAEVIQALELDSEGRPVGETFRGIGPVRGLALRMGQDLQVGEEVVWRTLPVSTFDGKICVEFGWVCRTTSKHTRSLWGRGVRCCFEFSVDHWHCVKREIAWVM